MADFLSTAVDPWTNPNAWDTIQIGPMTWFGKFEVRGAARKYNWQISAGLGFAGAFEIFQSQPPAEFSVTFYLWATEQYASYLQLLDVLTYSPTHLPPGVASQTSSGSDNGGAVAAAAANLNAAVARANESPTPANIQAVNVATANLRAAQASSPSAKGAGKEISALNVVHPQLQNNRITQAIVKSIGDLQKQSDDLLFSFTVEFAEFVPQKSFQPQSPDDAAIPMDPTLNNEKRAALKKLGVSQQEFANTAAEVGLGPSLP